jgi:hypothetical protein
MELVSTFRAATSARGQRTEKMPRRPIRLVNGSGRELASGLDRGHNSPARPMPGMAPVEIEERSGAWFATCDCGWSRAYTSLPTARDARRGHEHPMRRGHGPALAPSPSDREVKPPSEPNSPARKAIRRARDAARSESAEHRELTANGRRFTMSRSHRGWTVRCSACGWRGSGISSDQATKVAASHRCARKPRR